MSDLDQTERDTRDNALAFVTLDGESCVVCERCDHLVCVCCEICFVPRTPVCVCDTDPFSARESRDMEARHDITAPARRMRP